MGRNDNAVVMHSGFFLNPVGTEAQGAGDLAPVQLFEIVRPNSQAINIGRLFTSCVCVTLEADKTYFASGEPAILRLRNTKATPQNGQLYAVYVQLNSPIRTVLRFDTFVQSSQFLPSGAGQPPTRGDIVVDGVVTPTSVTEDGIEIIVPKADNYIPDTSEYTLRKRAEAEAAEKKVAAGKDAKSEVSALEEKAKETLEKEAAEKQPEKKDVAETAAAKAEPVNEELREKIASGIENIEKRLDVAAAGAERRVEADSTEAKIAAKKAAVAARLSAREAARKAEPAAGAAADTAASIGKEMLTRSGAAEASAQ